MWISTGSATLDELERRLRSARVQAKVSATRGAFRAFPRLAGSLLQISAAGFSPAPIPRFFSSDVREIAPTLNDDLLDLYGRAGQALANRFTFFNFSVTFDSEVDWEPQQSLAWRGELHAFDYALELACTFRISREEKYARHLRYLIAHWIAANPPAAGTGWQPQTLARRVRNWMLAADLARSEWEEEFSALAAASLALQLAFLLGHLDSLPSRAARLDASRALLCASRFFTGAMARHACDAARDLLSAALAGARSEPWPQSLLTRAQAQMEWLLLAPAGMDSAFLTDGLRATLDELEAILMPNGTLPLVGPEARLNHEDLFDLAALAAVKLESPEWKARAGGFGILPHLWLGEDGKQRFESLKEIASPLHDHVDAAGEILRIVGPQDSALIVAARPPQSADDHQDFTSYELTLDDQRVVVDSGGYSPEETAYFRGAHAHNVILVDGVEPQFPCEEHSRNVVIDKVSADCTRLRIEDRGFLFLGVRHQRAWFRLAENNWLILDCLEGQGVHRCTGLMHFYPTFEVLAAGDQVVARSRGRSIQVLPVGSPRARASVTRGDDPQYPGWYAPEYGIKFAASVLVLDWTELELPWVGGTLINSRTDQPARQLDANVQRASVILEIAGVIYECGMR